jgi:hypothetical protein
VWCRTRGSGKQFQDFLAVHKLSTVQQKLSPCKPGFSTGNPQIEPGWRWLQPFPPGRKHEISHVGRGSVGEAGDQPDGAQGLGWTQGGWPVKREINRTAWTSPAGRKAVGRPSRRSAWPRARARPSRRAQPIWHEISRVRVGRAASDRSGRSRTVGRTARGDAAEATRAGQRKRPLHA